MLNGVFNEGGIVRILETNDDDRVDMVLPFFSAIADRLRVIGESW